MARRLGALLRPDWVQAMTTLITGHKYFRWHDSGDLQGPAASQEYIRSGQGNTGRQTLAANPGACIASAHGSGYCSKEFINKSISNQG